jgi:hypothetical protein
MQIPELYRYGRLGKWFGIWPFVIYMVDGVYQARHTIYIRARLLTSIPSLRLSSSLSRTRTGRQRHVLMGSGLHSMNLRS